MTILGKSKDASEAKFPRVTAPADKSTGVIIAASEIGDICYIGPCVPGTGARTVCYRSETGCDDCYLEPDGPCTDSTGAMTPRTMLTYVFNVDGKVGETKTYHRDFSEVIQAIGQVSIDYWGTAQAIGRGTKTLVVYASFSGYAGSYIQGTVSVDVIF